MRKLSFRAQPVHAPALQQLCKLARLNILCLRVLIPSRAVRFFLRCHLCVCVSLPVDFRIVRRVAFESRAFFSRLILMLVSIACALSVCFYCFVPSYVSSSVALNVCAYARLPYQCFVFLSRAVWSGFSKLRTDFLTI